MQAIKIVIILLTKREKPICLGIEPAEMDHYFAIGKIFENFEAQRKGNQPSNQHGHYYFFLGIM